MFRYKIIDEKEFLKIMMVFFQIKEIRNMG